MSSAHGAKAFSSGAESFGAAGAKEKKLSAPSSAREFGGMDSQIRNAKTAPAAILASADVLDISVANTFGLTSRMSESAKTSRSHLLGVFEQGARSIAVVPRLPG